MPARTLYVGQTVTLTSNRGIIKFFPVQSASCDVNRPIEDILSFGRLGSLGRVQTAVSTCKSSIKTYLIYNTGTGATSLDFNIISTLTGEALAGAVSTLDVSPNGFTMSGILTSLSIEISNGSFATAEMGFAGIGEPAFKQPPTGASFIQSTQMPASFQPVTSTFISGNLLTGCANSVKFSLDIPNEPISCLGGKVTGAQVSVAPNFLMVAKPPFKTSLTVEGTSVTPPTNTGLIHTYFGYLDVQMINPKVTARSFNNAVGNIGANYSYTLEDVTAGFDLLDPIDFAIPQASIFDLSGSVPNITEGVRYDITDGYFQTGWQILGWYHSGAATGPTGYNLSTPTFVVNWNNPVQFVTGSFVASGQGGGTVSVLSTYVNSLGVTGQFVENSNVIGS
jgi:hypothetical protein